MKAHRSKALYPEPAQSLSMNLEKFAKLQRERSSIRSLDFEIKTF